MIALRASDGAPPPSTYRPTASTGVYVPTTLPVGFGWGKVTPWRIESGAQFRPGPPTALQSGEWARDYNEVQSVGGKASANRSAAQTEAARFWEVTGSVAYKDILRSALDPKGSLIRNARLLALTSMAQADSYIAVFDAKYAYNFWQPVTAIRNGDLDGNDTTALDAGWVSLIDTPMHPEYPCAHCTNAGAIAAVLERELGSQLPGLRGSVARCRNPPPNRPIGVSPERWKERGSRCKASSWSRPPEPPDGLSGAALLARSGAPPASGLSRNP